MAEEKKADTDREEEQDELKSLLKHKPTFRELWQSYPRVFRLILEADRSRFWKILALSTIQAPVAWLRIYAIKLITDSVLEKSVSDFVLALALMAGTALVDDLADTWRDVQTEMMRYAFERHLGLKTMRHVARLPLSTLEDPKFRELNKAFRERKHVALNIVEMFIQLPAVLFSFAGVATAAAYIPGFVVLILVASFLLRFFLMFRVPHFNWSVLNYESRQGRMGNAFYGYLTGVWHLVQCKLLGLPEQYMTRWDGVFCEGLDEKKKVMRASALANLAGEIVRNAGSVVGMGFVGWKVMSGAATMSALTVFMSAYGNLTNVATRLAFMLARLQKDWMFIPLFERFFAVKPESETGAEVPVGELRIEFKDVWFAYPGADKFALRGVNLEFRTGERIALTGMIGAGKTTLIKLLLGIYKPSKGNIYVNGVDLNGIKPTAWFRDLSFIAQNPVEFEDGLAELVHHGQITEPIDMARMERVAESVGFDRVVAKLGKGWQTHVGKEWAIEEDPGHEFSGGQAKLLVIVRQLYRSQARICLFDEGANNLDANRKTLFYQGTAELRGKLVIHSTHDAEALKYVDRVVELPSPEKGEADETDSISDLQTDDMN